MINITALAALRPSPRSQGFAAQVPRLSVQGISSSLQVTGCKQGAQESIGVLFSIKKRTAAETHPSTVTRCPSSHVAFQVITYGCQGSRLESRNLKLPED